MEAAPRRSVLLKDIPTPIVSKDVMHPRLDKIKQHVKDNKVTYIVGASCVAAGAVVGGVVVYLKVHGISVDSSVSVTQGIAYKSPVTVNNVTTVIDKALGDSGDVIKSASGEIYRSRNELSRMTGLSMAAIGKYFKGEIPNLGGEQYEILGKADILARLFA